MQIRMAGITLPALIAIALSAMALLAGQADANPPPPSPSVFQTENIRVELAADRATVKPGEELTLTVSFKLLKPGLHAYGYDMPDPSLGKPTRVVPLASEDFAFDQPIYPPSKVVEQFGVKLTEYDKDFAVTVRGRASERLPGGPTTIRVRFEYQVCTADSCIPEDEPPPLELTLTGDSTLVRAAAATQPEQAASAGPAGTAETPRLWNIELTAASWPIGLLLSVVVGLALNLTPCVLPIIPLTVGYFVYQSQQSGGKTGRRGILLAGVSFAAGMVATFLLLGVVVMLAKEQFSVIFESPPVILGLGLFIVVMALGMFGVYPVQLPNFIGQWAGARAGLGGALVMGALAAVMSTPCTGPLLGGMITFAMKLPTALGLISFVGLGLGMAMPYVVLTAAPGLLDNVPRSGRWTELVRVALGFLLLGLAMSVFSGFKSSPDRWQFAIWASLMLACTIWVCAKIIRGANEAKWVWPVRLALLTAVVAGIGHSWPAEGGNAATPAFAKAGENGGPVDGGTFMIGRTLWFEYDEGLLDRARDAGLPVMLDLLSDKCANCEILEREVWPTDIAHDALQGFVPVKVNTSRSEGRPLLNRYEGIGVPRLVFIDSEGRVVKVVNPDPSSPVKFAAVVAEVRRMMSLQKSGG